MMEGAGGIIFDNLPIIFALGVAIGLASGDGVAAIAAFVGFIVMNKTMGAFCILHLKMLMTLQVVMLVCWVYRHYKQGVWRYYRWGTSCMVLQQIL